MNEQPSKPKTCGDCKFWIEKAADPVNIGAPKRGECRESPPSTTAVPQPGRIVIVSAYPDLEANFAACSRHAPKLVS